MSAFEKTPRKQGMGHVISVSSKRRIVLGMCLMLLPGVADTSEFTLAVVINMTHMLLIFIFHILWKNMFLPLAACPCGYIQFEFLRTSLR